MERVSFRVESFFRHIVGRAKLDFKQRLEVDYSEVYVGEHPTTDLSAKADGR